MANNARKPPRGPPMNLGNMRELGVRSLLVSCRKCHVARVMNMDAYDAGLTVPSFGPRMVCAGCGTKGADVRPNWIESKPHIPKP